jgi:hypothetical protein
MGSTTITDTQLNTFTATASVHATTSVTTTITDTQLTTFTATGAVLMAPSPVLAYSIVSLRTQKMQQVQVFDPYGNFLTIWKDAPHISGLKDTVNCAQGQLKLVLPRAIDSYGAPGQTLSDGTVALQNQVKIYLFGPGLPKTGLLKFSGYIDTIEPSVTDAQQQGVTVTLTPWSAAFGDHGYGGSLQFNSIDPVQLFYYWFNTTDPITGVKYTDPMTWAPGNPTSSGNTVNYLIQGLDLKSIADTVLTMLGSGWFWRPNPDNTVTVGQVPSTPQHTFQLGRHFASMSYSVDNTQRKNVIYVVGSSHTIKASATGASAKPPGQGGIGQRLLQVQDSRLTDIPSCQIVANALLSLYDVQQIRAKFRVVDYRGNSSGALGFDIESLKVGDTISIANARGHNLPSTWGSFIWGVSRWGQSSGAIFNQTIPIASIDYNWSYCDVEAGILAPSQDRRLFQLQRKFSDFTLGVV